MKSQKSPSEIKSSDIGLSETFNESNNEQYEKTFEGKVRCLASSSIITIPVNITRELELKLGETVIIKIKKSDDLIPSKTEDSDHRELVNLKITKLSQKVAGLLIIDQNFIKQMEE